MVKIIVADDHCVLREGLSALIHAVVGWQVVAQAQDGLEVISAISKHSPDIVILDLSMPTLGGIEALARIKKMPNPPKTLVLSARDDENTASEAIEAGAHGFVSKKSSSDEIEFAIKSILRGQIYLSPCVASGVLNQSRLGRDANPLDELSTREREVMKLLCEGHPNRDIASLLHISPRTVDSHRANIMKKLGVQSNAALTQLAVKHSLIE